MTADDKKPETTFKHLNITGTSIADLRGRQSVRTTFKLSPGSIGALSIVASLLGIKQKSLFDHLIEDIQSLSAIADTVRSEEFERREAIQKTYVISRKSLHCLDQISRDYDMPRDILVEYSVQRLLPLIIKEREKHEYRIKAANDFRRVVTQGNDILGESANALGMDDPVYLKLKAAIKAMEQQYKEIETLIEKGKMIEDYLS